jgi:hypothetical protein
MEGARRSCSHAWALGCAALLSAPAAAQDPPSGIIFSRTHVSLGRVEAAGEIEHRFAFRVAGREPVQILDVRPSCGCIAPGLPKRVYAPGEQGELVFRVHAASQPQGPRRFTVSLHVRQGAQSTTIPLTLDVDLFKPIEITPSTLLLHLNGTSSIEQNLTIAELRPRPLKILEVRSSTPKIVARLKEAPGEDGRVQQVSLTIAGDFPAGQTQETVVIRTADAEHAELVVPVTVVRPSRIRVLPDRLHGPRPASPQRPATWQVLLSDSKGAPIEIESVECADASVAVAWPSGPTTRCRLAVTVAPPPQTGPFEAEIVVRVAKPIATRLTLPIRLQ